MKAIGAFRLRVEQRDVRRDRRVVDDAAPPASASQAPSLNKACDTQHQSTPFS